MFDHEVPSGYDETGSYIDRFRGDARSQMYEHGEYCYRTILAAVQHLQSIDVEKVRAQFEAKSKAEQKTKEQEEGKKPGAK